MSGGETLEYIDGRSDQTKLFPSDSYWHCTGYCIDMIMIMIMIMIMNTENTVTN